MLLQEWALMKVSVFSPFHFSFIFFCCNRCDILPHTICVVVWMLTLFAVENTEMRIFFATFVLKKYIAKTGLHFCNTWE